MDIEKEALWNERVDFLEHLHTNEDFLTKDVIVAIRNDAQIHPIRVECSRVVY